MLLRGARWTVLRNSYLCLWTTLHTGSGRASVPVVLPVLGSSARPALTWEACWQFHACLLCRAVNSVLKLVPLVLGFTMRASESGNGVDLFPVLVVGQSSCGASSGRWCAGPCCPLQEASRCFLLSWHRGTNPACNGGAGSCISMRLPGGVLSSAVSLLYFVLELFLA